MWAGVDLNVLWADSASWNHARLTDLNSNNTIHHRTRSCFISHGGSALIRVICCCGSSTVITVDFSYNSSGAMGTPEINLVAAGCFFPCGMRRLKAVWVMHKQVLFCMWAFLCLTVKNTPFFWPLLLCLCCSAQDAVGCGTRSLAGRMLMLERWSPSPVLNTSSISPGMFLHVRITFMK